MHPAPPPQELVDAFPAATAVRGEGLAAYAAAVRSLADMNEQQRRQVSSAFKRHK
jgi:hypothetical protein